MGDKREHAERFIINRRLNRREFLKEASRGVLTATLVAGSFDPLNLTGKWVAGQVSDKETPLSEKEKKGSKPVEYRRLGRTGLMVSTIGYGAMRTTNPAVIQRALDLGINYIDTAHCYQGGNNEKLVGEVLKKRRKDAFIATKVHINNRKEMILSVESSLKSLQTDYIDVIQLHGLKRAEQVTNEEAIAALSQLKKDGKARFLGLTTHENEAAVTRAAAKTGFYDVALIKYNFRSSQSLKDATEEAAKAGLGIVAMKTQAGGYNSPDMGNLSPHQAALKWVLENKNVATTIPSMVSFAQLEENVKVMGKKMNWNDRKVLSMYARATNRVYCRLCGKCRDTCSRRVSIPEVMRFSMYAQGYGDLKLGRSQYASLVPAHNAGRCLGCTRCTARCANGLDIASRMIQSHYLLS